MKKRWQNNQQININIYILIYLQVKTQNKIKKKQKNKNKTKKKKKKKKVLSIIQIYNAIFIMKYLLWKKIKIKIE
jgi:hypothetical protein